MSNKASEFREISNDNFNGSLSDSDEKLYRDIMDKISDTAKRGGFSVGINVDMSSDILHHLKRDGFSVNYGMGWGRITIEW